MGADWGVPWARPDQGSRSNTRGSRVHTLHLHPLTRGCPMGAHGLAGANRIPTKARGAIGGRSWKVPRRNRTDCAPLGDREIETTQGANP